MSFSGSPYGINGFFSSREQILRVKAGAGGGGGGGSSGGGIVDDSMIPFILGEYKTRKQSTMVDQQMLSKMMTYTRNSIHTAIEEVYQ